MQTIVLETVDGVVTQRALDFIKAEVISAAVKIHEHRVGQGVSSEVIMVAYGVNMGIHLNMVPHVVNSPPTNLKMEIVAALNARGIKTQFGLTQYLDSDALVLLPIPDWNTFDTITIPMLSPLVDTGQLRPSMYQYKRDRMDYQRYRDLIYGQWPDGIEDQFWEKETYPDNPDLDRDPRTGKPKRLNNDGDEKT